MPLLKLSGHRHCTGTAHPAGGMCACSLGPESSCGQLTDQLCACAAAERDTAGALTTTAVSARVLSPEASPASDRCCTGMLAQPRPTWPAPTAHGNTPQTQHRMLVEAQFLCFVATVVVAAEECFTQLKVEPHPTITHTWACPKQLHWWGQQSPVLPEVPPMPQHAACSTAGSTGKPCSITASVAAQFMTLHCQALDAAAVL